MSLLTPSGISPPGPSLTGFWLGFFIAAVVIVAVVALVLSVIRLVNRIEQQAATAVVVLAHGAHASAPLLGLVQANAHLEALGRALSGAAAPAAPSGPRSSRSFKP